MVFAATMLDAGFPEIRREGSSNIQTSASSVESYPACRAETLKDRRPEVRIQAAMFKGSGFKGAKMEKDHFSDCMPAFAGMTSIIHN